MRAPFPHLIFSFKVLLLELIVSFRARWFHRHFKHKCSAQIDDCIDFHFSLSLQRCDSFFFHFWCWFSTLLPFHFRGFDQHTFGRERYSLFFMVSRDFFMWISLLNVLCQTPAEWARGESKIVMAAFIDNFEACVRKREKIFFLIFWCQYRTSRCWHHLSHSLFSLNPFSLARLSKSLMLSELTIVILSNVRRMKGLRTFSLSNITNFCHAIDYLFSCRIYRVLKGTHKLLILKCVLSAIKKMFQFHFYDQHNWVLQRFSEMIRAMMCLAVTTSPTPAPIANCTLK